MKNIIGGQTNQNNHYKNMNTDQNLEFRSTKKRLNKGVNRSKSTYSSVQADQKQTFNKYAQNHDNFYPSKTYNFYNCGYDLKKDEMKDLTNLNFDYGRLQNKNQYNYNNNSKQTQSRGVKRLTSSKENQKVNKVDFNMQPQNYGQNNDCNKNFSKSAVDYKIKHDQYNFKSFQTNYNEYYSKANFNKVKPIQKQCLDSNIPQKFSSSCSSSEFAYKHKQVEKQPDIFYQSLNFNELGSGHSRNKSDTLSISDNFSYTQQKQIKISFNNSTFKKKNILNKTTSINSIISQNINNTKLKISDFQLGLCSSEDIFGKTYPARHIKTGLIVCIKEMSKRQVQFQMKKLIQLLKIQLYCSQQYIVDIYGMFQEGVKIYLIMQYHCQGNLFLNIKSPVNTCNQITTLSYFLSICYAISQLHQKQILYRNIKPQKISLFYDICKISNLNWCARQQQMKGKGKASHMTNIQYSAPQLLQNGNKYTKQAQIWALGILLYEIYYGVTPTYKMSSNQAKKCIIKGQFMDKSEQKILVNEIIKKILQRKPYLRPNIKQLICLVQNAQRTLQKQKRVS